MLSNIKAIFEKKKRAFKKEIKYQIRSKKGIINFLPIFLIQLFILIIMYFISFVILIILFIIFLFVDFAGWWSSRKLGSSLLTLSLMKKFGMYTIVYIKDYSEIYEYDPEFHDQEFYEEYFTLQKEYFMDDYEAASKTKVDIASIQKQVWTNCDDDNPTYFRHATILEVLPWWISEKVIPYITVTILLSIPTIIFGVLVLMLHDNLSSTDRKSEIVPNLWNIGSHKSQEVSSSGCLEICPRGWTLNSVDNAMPQKGLSTVSTAWCNWSEFVYSARHRFKGLSKCQIFLIKCQMSCQCMKRRLFVNNGNHGECESSS